MTEAPKTWKRPEILEQERKGSKIDTTIVEGWIAQENDPERKAALQKVLKDDDYTSDALTECIDALITKGIKTSDEVAAIILPRMAAPFVAYTEAVSGEKLLDILDLAPPEELTLMLVDAKHFRSKFVSFKLSEMARRVPDRMLHWAFRDFANITKADQSKNKSLSQEIGEDWAARIDADGARRVLLQDKDDREILPGSIQLELANKIQESAYAAEILCKNKVTDDLSESTLRSLWKKLNPEDGEFVRCFGYYRDEN